MVPPEPVMVPILCLKKWQEMQENHIWYITISAKNYGKLQSGQDSKVSVPTLMLSKININLLKAMQLFKANIFITDAGILDYVSLLEQQPLDSPPLSNSFNVSYVSESHFFVCRSYVMWHMPCCEPNVPMGRLNSPTWTQLQLRRKSRCN